MNEESEFVTTTEDRTKRRIIYTEAHEQRRSIEGARRESVRIKLPKRARAGSRVNINCSVKWIDLLNRADGSWIFAETFDGITFAIKPLTADWKNLELIEASLLRLTFNDERFKLTAETVSGVRLRLQTFILMKSLRFANHSQLKRNWHWPQKVDLPANWNILICG